MVINSRTDVALCAFRRKNCNEKVTVSERTVDQWRTQHFSHLLFF